MDATTVAIDLAKDVFELAFADAQGRISERKRLSRNAFSLQPGQPAAVAGGDGGLRQCVPLGAGVPGAGHQVRLLPARDVKPYVHDNKTDRADAAGILEADRCGQIALVAIKRLAHWMSDAFRSNAA